MSDLRNLILLRFKRMTVHELGAVEAHGKRKGDVEHVDASRTHMNEFLVGDEHLTALADQRIVDLQMQNAERKRVSLRKGRRKTSLQKLEAAIMKAGDDPKALADVIGWPWDRKNVHPFTEGMLSISHEWFLDDGGKISDARVEKFKTFASSYLAEEFGREVIYARLDLDEKTPHVSFIVAPEHENRKTKRLELSHHSHRLFGQYEAEVPVFDGDKPDPRQAKRSFLRRTAPPAPSAQCTWNTFFARSRPTVIISDMTALLCGSLQTHLGTLMPSGSGHIIKAGGGGQLIACTPISVTAAGPNCRRR